MKTQQATETPLAAPPTAGAKPRRPLLIAALVALIAWTSFLVWMALR